MQFIDIETKEETLIVTYLATSLCKIFGVFPYFKKYWENEEKGVVSFNVIIEVAHANNYERSRKTLVTFSIVDEIFNTILKELRMSYFCIPSEKSHTYCLHGGEKVRKLIYAKIKKYVKKRDKKLS